MVILRKIQLLLLLAPLFAFGQTQRVRGTVSDKTTQLPLLGVTVQIVGTQPLLGATTDESGHFLIEKAPLGRARLRFSYLGYLPFETEALAVTAAREVLVAIEMTEASVTTGEAVIVGSQFAAEPLNPLTVVSGRSFSVEETERLPASVNDPGRMALSFPGVQKGSDEDENDIIVRGNSSAGMLWRVEGIDVPNPNHFARPGASGGGITLFSAQVLGRSDFSTGAFAAEYGNALSGVFDMRFRKGNMNAREHRARVSVIGLDAATEGPLRAGRSSYLANYRYSTLGVLNKMGFYLVGERVVNDFQDLSFNLAFDSPDRRSQWTVFGVGGASLEHYQPVETPAERFILKPDHWEDRRRTAQTGVLGTTWTRALAGGSWLKAVFALDGSDVHFTSDTLSLADARYNYENQRFTDKRLSAALHHFYKINARTSLKSGAMAHQIFLDFFKETAPRSSTSNIQESQRVLNIAGAGSTQTLQAWSQLSRELTPRLTLNAGLHGLALLLNQTASIEPRAALRFAATPRQTLSLAYGLHSKTLPLASFFYTEFDSTLGQQVFPNHDLPLLKAQHFVAGYQWNLPRQLRLTVEAYWQKLRNVPVSPDPEKAYYYLNTQTGFPELAAVAEGTGENRGLDLALEKTFSSRFYFIFTGSLLSATYRSAGARTYNSPFNSRFSSAFTLGREFVFRRGAALQLGARAVWAGGNRYTPLDAAASSLSGTYVALEAQTNEGQVPDYFRVDTRVLYRFNRGKMSGSVSLDLQNATNRRSVTSVGYNAASNSLYFRKDSNELLPVLGFQFDF